MRRLLGCTAIALVVCAAFPLAEVDPDNIVTLVSPGFGYTLACPDVTWSEMNQVLNPDASRSPFVIPKGGVFVMTGTNWSGYYPAMALEIDLRNLTNGATEVLAMVPGKDLSDVSSYAAGSLMIRPGVVAGHGAALCTRLRHVGSTTPVTDIRIYGYFAKTSNKAAPVIGR